ncbi:type I-F CRISPR-associated endoribonuclease Cas6/Csy4 [Oceanospirillum linum]|uniref:Type I-F CRISPR-associated endoribonuclease Cas6/Csy4 n=1 Tax=Oceanospirillum linum TaxID=966 RepID=A0A1T1HGD2_OCELI|nr:type I-F CRISPR-associated endoribonuclease Cas6/Csy4 [Oceanospirillum linum]OOV88800.1 type I-F CRISPR-associated endoribonuclease Cas6/Csy4 [Oceanospirillum linum]SEF99448.1 CRISPR-associated protein, Csy4 family [Oleiphilus messinensis]SMP22492.1 CRISPR-associated endonuclease Csy4 [Oceanospirillum linum]
MKWHYFIIRYIPSDADEFLLAGRCILALHHFLYRNKANSIGIHFPDWSDRSVGKRIAFMSENEDLLTWFKKERYFLTMAENDLFEMTEIVQTSLTDKKGVAFVRNQKAGKLTSASKARRIRRAKRRAEARGEVYKSRNQESDRELDHFHSIHMESTSTGKAFTLFVGKVEEPGTGLSQKEFNSYGLSSQNQQMVLLPIIS